jgi:hypothetical protein
MASGFLPGVSPLGCRWPFVDRSNAASMRVRSSPRAVCEWPCRSMRLRSRRIREFDGYGEPRFVSRKGRGRFLQSV